VDVATHFGHEYIARNQATRESDTGLALGFAPILALMQPAPRSILEVGANVGRNIRALKSLTDANLFAAEPNPVARKALDGLCFAYSGRADALPDCRMGLVFTCGVLIHVPPEQLERSYREMYRVSTEWLLTMEYFAPTETAIPWRDDVLWKRDYGGMWLDLFPDLQLAGHGFLWSRTTPFDDLNWWLFRKGQ
jgi:spore coat polysaccharide biosynthesis protein SpsF